MGKFRKILDRFYFTGNKKKRKKRGSLVKRDLKFIEKTLEKLSHILFMKFYSADPNSIHNIQNLLEVFADWIHSNKIEIQTRIEKFFNFENQKWKIEESEIPEGEYDWGKYEPSKKCYDCGYLMKTIYLRDKSKTRRFKTIGLICIYCNKVIIDPKRYDKYLNLLKEQDGKTDESETKETIE